MERLTFKTNIGAGTYKIGAHSGETIMPSDIHKEVPEYAESIVNALTKLAAYEDIGTVDELRAAKKIEQAVEDFVKSFEEVLNREYVSDENDESDSCEQYCSDCPHRICALKQEPEVCKCGREKDNSPHFKAKLAYNTTNEWHVKGCDGYGESYVCWIPDAKYCPWCGGRLPEGDGE